MTLFAIFRKLLAKTCSSKCQEWFSTPVDIAALNIPDYPSIVKQPMDLGTVLTKCHAGTYGSSSAMAADVMLTFDNALLYSGQDSLVGLEALRLKKYFLSRYEPLVAKFGDVALISTAGSLRASVTAAAAASTSRNAADSSADASSLGNRAEAVNISGGPLSLSSCRDILDALQLLHPDELTLFLAPMDELDLAMSTRRVKKQMCVQWMHDRLNKGSYTSNQSFAEDGEQIWKNCVIFNGPDVPITKSAMTLRAEFRRLFAIEFGVPTLTAHMEMVNEAHRFAHERWKLECELFAVDESDRPRPPVRPGQPIITHKKKRAATSAKAASSSAAAMIVPAAAAAASSSPAAECAATSAAASAAFDSTSSSAAAAFAVPHAASSLLPSSAADRVERMLTGLGAAVLSGDLALVLQQARQFSSMQERLAALESERAEMAAARKRQERAAQNRIAELEAERTTLLSTLENQDHAMEQRVRGVKREKLDTEEALVKTTQLKRKGERELDSERKKLRATEDQLEQKTEQLEQLSCIACMDARASVVYHPCACAPYCAACDAAYQGGPNRAAATGFRSCPKCRAEIASTAKVHLGQ